MEYTEIVIGIVGLAVTAAVSIISYFVKRTIDRQDDCATKADLAKAESDINDINGELKELNDKYATKAEVEEIKRKFDKIDKDIDFIKENTLRKSEFTQLFVRLENKVDELMRR